MWGVWDTAETSRNYGSCFPSTVHYGTCGLHGILRDLHLLNLKMCVKPRMLYMLWMGGDLETRNCEWRFQKQETVVEEEEGEEEVEGGVAGTEVTMGVADTTGLVIISEMIVMTMVVGVTVISDSNNHGGDLPLQDLRTTHPRHVTAVEEADLAAP